MSEARAKLARLRRLETIRAIAKRAAALEAAQAEASLAQLQALGDRARLLAADYGGRAAAGAGLEAGAGLRSLGQFTVAIQQLEAAQFDQGDASRRPLRPLASHEQVNQLAHRHGPNSPG